MSRCRHARDLHDYVDRELPLDAALAFEAHLDSCASCRAELAAARALDDALLALPRPRLATADRQRLRAAIATRIDAPTGSARPIDRPSLRRLAPLAAAAAALAAGVTLFVLLRAPPRANPPTPTPSATPNSAGSQAATAPATPASLFAVAPNDAGRADVHSEVAAILRQLAKGHAAAEGGELLTNFLVAIEPLRQRGLPIASTLLALLHDEDGELATTGAQLLATAVVAGTVRRDEPGLIATLDRALRRADRATAMLHALEAIGTRGAYEAIVNAAAIPNLREPVLFALAGAGRADTREALQRCLIELLRGRPTDVALAERVVARLAIRNVESLQLLAALARAGLTPALVDERLERTAATARPLLAAALRGDDPAARRDALSLAPRAGDPTLADAIVDAAIAYEEGAAALAALRALGGTPALLAVARWKSASVPTKSLSQLGEECFAAIAAATPPADLAQAVADVGGMTPRIALAFADLAITAGGAGGPPLRAALLDHPLSTGELRARAALAIARGHEPFAPERALALLTALAPELVDDANADGGLAGALLVLLYEHGREAELTRGLAALGWTKSRAQVARLAAAARRILDERSLDRSVERLDTLLALGP